MSYDTINAYNTNETHQNTVRFFVVLVLFIPKRLMYMDMMNDYGFNEGIEFNGLIPKVMEADGISTIGASDFNAMLFKNGQLGCGSLEVIDFQTVMGGGGKP
jgi:hypothetical protein